MQRIRVGRALVRIAPDEIDADIAFSNSFLLSECDKQDALIPCPIVVPAGSDDYPQEEEQVQAMLEHGSGAAFIRPLKDNWSLKPWASEGLFKSLQDHHVPVLCLERMVSIEDAAALAEAYPQMPVILAELGYRSLRVLLPLLETFGNVYLSVGSNFAVHRGIEQLSQKVGAERLLFGTGLPEADPMTAVTTLMYSEISDEEKALIGSANLQGLIEGIEQ
jgi:hypothetical protein